MSSSNARDKREAQILDPNSEENQQYARDKAADPVRFKEPKAMSDLRATHGQYGKKLRTNDPTLPAVLGNNNLYRGEFDAIGRHIGVK